MVQFGLASDPTETSKWHHTIADDPTGVQTNALGTLTYAMAGPNSRTTQLFVNTAANGRLDSQGFTPFGKVTEGLHLLQEDVFNPTPGSSAGASQGKLTSKGNNWLLKEYPGTDIITSTELVVPEEEKPAADDGAYNDSSSSSSSSSSSLTDDKNGENAPVPNAPPDADKNGAAQEEEGDGSESGGKSNPGDGGTAKAKKASGTPNASSSDDADNSDSSSDDDSKPGHKKTEHHDHDHHGHHGSDDHSKSMHKKHSPNVGKNDDHDAQADAHAEMEAKIRKKQAAAKAQAGASTTPQQVGFSVKKGFLGIALVLEVALLAIVIRVR